MAILFISFQNANKLSEQLHGKLHVDSNWHFCEYIYYRYFVFTGVAIQYLFTVYLLALASIGWTS